MMLQSYILQFRKQLVKKIRRGYFDKLKRLLLLLLLPLSLLCACTTAPAEQADAPFSFYYRCAEVAFGGEDGVIRAEAAPLEADADLRTVVLQYLKGPASPDIDGRVLFSAARSVVPGEFVMVRITGAEDGDLVGEMEENA